MSNHESDKYAKGLVVGALIGGAVGAITALLFAPKSGRELRRDIADRSIDVYNNTSDYLTNLEENVSSNLSHIVNEGKYRAENIVNSARQKAEDLIQGAEHVIHGAKEKASNVKEDVSHTVTTLKGAAKASADAFKAELKNPNNPNNY